MSQPRHANTYLLAWVLGLLQLVVSIGTAGQVHAQHPERSHPKAIVLGFDGIDPDLLRRWIDAGELPSVKRLADAGGFVPLDTVFPAQSPVCWASMMNGTNPGKHSVTGFVRRVDGSYTPELGVIRVGTKRIWAGLLLPPTAAILIVLAGAGLGGLLALVMRRRRIVVWSGRGTWLAVPLAVVAVLGLRAWIPASAPAPENARLGEAFFEPIAKAGHRVTLLNTPMDWPVLHRDNVTEYAGFNVPDLRGTFGIYSYWTTEYRAAEYVKSEMGADVRRVEFLPDADLGLVAQTTIDGARDLTTPGYPPVSVPLRLAKDIAGDQLAIHVAGSFLNQATEWQVAASLRAGEWSDWTSLEFSLNPIVKLRGRVRFYCEQIEPVLSLYCTPVSIDPIDPAGGYEIASPRSFGVEVQDIAGFPDNPGLDTLGWPELTHPVYDMNLRDQAFVEHCIALEEKRANVMFNQLARGNTDLLCAWYFGSDRIQHMMYRYIDPEHHDFEALQGSPPRDAVLEIYRFMDRTIERVLRDHCGPDTLLLVMSDHGFAPFRRAVSINRWLVEEGYLVLKGQQSRRHATDLFGKRDQLLNEIDWSKTRAYALGLGDIFLNIRGREPQGSVAPQDAPALAQEISRKLEKLQDPAHPGKRVVSRVYLRDGAPDQPAIQWGAQASGFAEMHVGFMPGYRVSWQTTLGYADEPVIFRNDKRWSGDHCSLDPLLIPGTLLSNRRIEDSRPNIMSLAPTVLQHFGLLQQEQQRRMPGRELAEHDFDAAPLRLTSAASN